MYNDADESNDWPQWDFAGQHVDRYIIFCYMQNL